MLIDSNIVIIATRPDQSELREWIAKNVPVVSSISYVEVLGYHKRTSDERQQLQDFCCVHSLADYFCSAG